MCVSCEVEYHLHIKRQALPVTGRGILYVFPVRYGHRLRIKIVMLSPNRPWSPVRVFPVRYEHQLI
jgi:hypothetical protein